jgi:hypothetical protein
MLITVGGNVKEKTDGVRLRRLNTSVAGPKSPLIARETTAAAQQTASNSGLPPFGPVELC